MGNNAIGPNGASYIAGALTPEQKKAIDEGAHKAGHAVLEGLKDLGHAIAHPIDTTEHALHDLKQGAKDTVDTAKQGVSSILKFVDEHPETLLM